MNNNELKDYKQYVKETLNKHIKDQEYLTEEYIQQHNHYKADIAKGKQQILTIIYNELTREQ